MLKYEWKTFLTALSFYTRFPVGKIDGWSPGLLSRSTRYLPLVGGVVGAVSAGLYLAAATLWPSSMALLLSILLTIIFTGAFHEDGFADFCDGMGGGYTPERVLDIMKDSRNGTYGTIGLLGILVAKFLSLSFFAETSIPIILLSGHVFSRVAPVILIYTSRYVRLDATSKSKPIGMAGSRATFLIALVTGMLILLLFNPVVVVVVVVVFLLTIALFRLYVHNRLGGYTGDILGALQQLCEVMFYLTLLVFVHHQWNLF